MGKLYAKASMHKTRSRPEEKPILLPACLAIKSVCLFLFLGFCVVFEELFLNITRNELVACKLHRERGASAGDRAQSCRVA